MTSPKNKREAMRCPICGADSSNPTSHCCMDAEYPAEAFNRTPPLTHDQCQARYEELMAQAEKLAAAHESIVSAKVRGCVEYKGCECWWQTSQKALAEFQKWKETK